MEKGAIRRFNQLWDDAGKDTLTLDYGFDQKYVIFSDLHIGDGSGADNFRQNKEIFKKALEYYGDPAKDYSLILLGDIEEYHQFPLRKILEEYGASVYDLFQRFEGKIYRVFGNHDVEWSIRDPLFPGHKRTAYEAIKLKKGNSVDIFITHGHQAVESIEKDIYVVRCGTAIFRELERIFKIKSKSILDWAPGTKDYIYDKWARDKQKIIICGHTHSPVFAKYWLDYQWVLKKYNDYDIKYNQVKKTGTQEEIDELKQRKKWLQGKRRYYINQRAQGRRFHKSPHTKLSTHYFNTGAGLFKDAVTNIEIDGDKIRLVYWFNKGKGDKPEALLPVSELDISSLLDQGTG
jgi:predicted phosphodiesterase